MYLSIAPQELADGIREFWPENEWENAADISFLESAHNAFAVRDTRTDSAPCGAVVSTIDSVSVVAELSIGYFQINTCNFPNWEPWRLYNARHNCGTAHLLWVQAGQMWTPWYFSAKRLGLPTA